MKKIERLKNENLNRYGQIYAKAFAGEPWNNPWKAEDATVHVKELLDSSQAYGLEYLINDRVVGFVLGTSKLLHFGRVFEIDCLAVDPSYQHNGIGKKLLEKIIDNLKEQGIVNISLLTASEGILPEFYKKYGFKKEEKLIFMTKDTDD